MIHYLRLNKNKTFETHDEDGKYMATITKSELPNFASVPLRLEDGITLEEVLTAYEPIYDLIVWRFDEHLAEVAKPQMIVKKMPPFKVLELEKLVVIKEGVLPTKGKKKSRKMLKPVVELVDFFHGVGFDKKGNKLTYDLTLLPLDLIKSCPVSIKHKMEANLLMGGKMFSIESEEVEGYNPTFIEFYNSLVNELTWFGSPSDRDKEAIRLHAERDKKDI